MEVCDPSVRLYTLSYMHVVSIQVLQAHHGKNQSTCRIDYWCCCHSCTCGGCLSRCCFRFKVGRWHTYTIHSLWLVSCLTVVTFWGTFAWHTWRRACPTWVGCLVNIILWLTFSDLVIVTENSMWVSTWSAFTIHQTIVCIRTYVIQTFRTFGDVFITCLTVGNLARSTYFLLGIKGIAVLASCTRFAIIRAFRAILERALDALCLILAYCVSISTLHNTSFGLVKRCTRRDCTLHTSPYVVTHIFVAIVAIIYGLNSIWEGHHDYRHQ